MIRDVRIRLFNSDTKYREYKKYWKLIERDYHLGKKGTDSKSYVWDNEISFVRLNKGFKIGEQSVSGTEMISHFWKYWNGWNIWRAGIIP